MPTTENTALMRQWLLLRALSSRRLGMTIREMAAEFGVSTRTILRDIATLQQIGFPILEKEVSEHGRKHWELNAESNGVPLSFTWDEAIALYLGRRYLDPLAGTPVWESVNAAFRKVRACLSEAALRHLDKMSTAFHHTHFGAGNYSEKSEIIDRLMFAVEDRRLTLMAYRSLSASEPFTYEVAPYGIVFHHNSLYLVAFSSDHQEIRHFKIDRIESVEPQDLKFQRPPEFELSQHLANSFGIYGGRETLDTVRIRFSADVARIVEESRWHHSQQLTREPDGSLVAEFQLGDLIEIKSWILSFGCKAVVLEPVELREEIGREAAGIVAALSQTRRN